MSGRGMKSSTIAKAMKAFARLGIKIQQPVSAVVFKEGATNQYAEIRSESGKGYLVRESGRLWPPFKRDDEAFNLASLSAEGITTNVVYAAPDHSFQICELWVGQQDIRLPNYLGEISGHIRRIHDSCRFKGEYPLSRTIRESYSRLQKDHRQRYQHHYFLILALVKIIDSDKQNFVSSHNDLLPSSVYILLGRAHFVDYEYSGRNHRAYDVAFFAIKAGLTGGQETKLLASYDHDEALDIAESYRVMKPIVSFLLLCWSGASSSSMLSESVLCLLNTQALRRSRYFQQRQSIAEPSHEQGSSYGHGEMLLLTN